jgi:hypothetical protein
MASDPKYELDPTVAELLDGIDTRLLDTTEGRKALCELDPLLFALIYLPNSLKDANGNITFADCHKEWAEIAKQWALAVRRPKENRHAFLAPRGTGKSTWWFLILPMWWGAFGHSKFVAAFAHNHTQTQRHLDNFKEAVKDKRNAALRQDFPKLVNAKTNREGVYVARNGFIFLGQGIDSQTLGLKYGDDRPDTILLDDIEPDEGSYSLYQMESRRTTLLDAILPLETMARVVISGTVTMPGSIVHQMIKYTKGYRSDDLEWVGIEKIKIHHAKPILRDEETGQERSFWPGNPKFALDVLIEMRHTRQFRKNYENDPLAVDAEYWSPKDFTYGSFTTAKTILSVDGAVTTGKKSDYTGLAIVGYCPPSPGERLGRCLVKYAHAVKFRGNDLREFVLGLIEIYPEIGGILVESNQGGEMWLETFHNMPVRVKTVHNTEKKEARAGRVLNFYQMTPTRVWHVEPLSDLEEQMCAFPQVPHDDLLDATGNAVLTYLRPPRPPRSGVRTRTPV